MLKRPSKSSESQDNRFIMAGQLTMGSTDQEESRQPKARVRPRGSLTGKAENALLCSGRSLRVQFTVPGEPLPKERPRVVNSHAYTPKRTQQYEQLVQAYALKAKVKPLVGAVKLTLRFYRGNKRRYDLDNAIKGVTDPLNGIAWADDSQIVELHAFKGYDKDNPRTEVEIEAV